jgi:hypothetical protein
VISLFKKGFLNGKKGYLIERRLSQDDQKVFSQKRFSTFFENAFLPTRFSVVDNV